MSVPPVYNPSWPKPRVINVQPIHPQPTEIAMGPMDMYSQQRYPEQPPRYHDQYNDNAPRAAREVRQRPARIEPQTQQQQQRRAIQRQQRPKRSEIGVCTKYTLFAENFIVFMIGAGATSLGAYILVVKQKDVRDALDFFLDPSCVMCLAGSIFLFMGVIGLFGSLRENTFFLKMYQRLMVLFLLIQMALSILTFVMYYSSDIKDKLFPTGAFKDAIRKYRDDIDMQNLIDTMQKELKCCGLTDSKEGFLDWNENPYFNCSDTNHSPERCSVPPSCCRQRHGELINHQCGWKAFKVLQGQLVPNSVDYTSNIYTLGCLKSLGNWIDKHALVVGGVLLGVILPQVFIIILASNLIKMIYLQKCRWER